MESRVHLSILLGLFKNGLTACFFLCHNNIFSLEWIYYHISLHVVVCDIRMNYRPFWRDFLK